MVDSGRRSFLIGAGLATASITGPASVAKAAGSPAATTTVASPPAAAPPYLQPAIERERANIRSIMAREDIHGAAVCFIHEGKPVWIEGFGVTDSKSRRPIGERTIFSLQSTSKNITAVAVMLAVQRGLLHLDEPITTYLPDFTVQSRFESLPAPKMTLRLLLSHRAGFTHEAPVGNNYDPAFPDFETHVQSISRTWLRFPVGERYRYSNLGIDLAGHILQTVSGMPFAECLETWIFGPLGMTDSTVATEVYAKRADRALGHAEHYAAVPLKTPLIPSGGVYSSARDMAAYLTFHLNKGNFAGKTLLDEKLWNEMHSFSLGGDYGLGVVRIELRYGDNTLRMLNHNGGGFGFGSVFDYCPQAQLGWVALFNQQGDGGYRFGESLINDTLTGRHGAHRPRLPAADLAPIELQKDQLEQFVGRYIGRSLSNEIKFQEGKLGMQVGPVFTPLLFTSPVDMFVTGPDGEATPARYFPARQDEVAHIESFKGEYSLDYNDGPHDPPGPNEPRWEAFLGDYAILRWGQPTQQTKVHRKNGYLYLDEMRLAVEPEPGLFFTPDGEAVDFRHPEPTWRNLRLHRISTPR
jgi:CubicO group peptidase (beta-lactamase class C family)